MAFPIVSLIVTGLLFAASLLLNKPKKSSFKPDDSPSTTSTVGTFIPVVVGRRLLDPIVIWDGSKERIHREQRIPGASSSGGGGWFGGGGSGHPRTTIYKEPGAHVIAIGLGRKLYRILENGRTIWTGPITPADTPSGSLVTFSEVKQQSTFQIYWGESDQPINTYLGQSNRLGVMSRWPRYFYIVWRKKALADSATWPDLQYEAAVTCTPGTLRDSSLYLSGDYGEGINPAEALRQLLTSPFPTGAGLDPSAIDDDALQVVADLMEEEELPMCMQWAEESAADAVATILADAGIAMPYTEEGVLTFIPQRPTPKDDLSGIPVMTDDLYVGSPPTREIRHGDRGADFLQFEFQNARRRYRTWPAIIRFSGQAARNGAYAIQKSALKSVTYIRPAGQVARRTAQSALGDLSSITVEALRGLGRLIAGQKLIYDDSLYVVVSKKPVLNSAKTELELLLDTFNVEPATPPTDDQDEEDTTTDPSADLYFTFVQTPDNSDQISVLRIRDNIYMAGSTIYVANDDEDAYYDIGDQPTAAAGGRLSNDLAFDSDDPLEDGPIIIPSNADILDVLDLSSDEASWLAGLQLMSINDELMFLRNVTAVAEDEWPASTAVAEDDYVQPSDTSTGFRYVCVQAGTTGSTEPTWPEEEGLQVTDGTAVWETRLFSYQLHGITRGEFSTTPGTHSAGDVAFIIQMADLASLSHPLIASGNTINIKSVPYNTVHEEVDIDDITPVEKTLA